jgi:hypothetical protein
MTIESDGCASCEKRRIQEKRDKVPQRFSLALGRIEISKSDLTASRIGGDLLKAYEEKKKKKRRRRRRRRREDVRARKLKTLRPRKPRVSGQPPGRPQRK